MGQAQALRREIFNVRARHVNEYVELELQKTEGLLIPKDEELATFWNEFDFERKGYINAWYLESILGRAVDEVLDSEDNSIEAFRKWWLKDDVQKGLDEILPHIVREEKTYIPVDDDRYHWNCGEASGECDVCSSRLCTDSVIEWRRQNSWGSTLKYYHHCSTCLLTVCGCGSVTTDGGMCRRCEEEWDERALLEEDGY